jgi:two-component system chemotaxis response regulator CheB
VSVKKVRILVVEDSLTVRMRIVAALSADPECEVVGEAEDGAQGIALCKSLRPDVMTLDMMLKQSTGLEVTEHIMAYCPTPIVIVSSSFNRGGMLRTYDALAAGALDAIEKPTGEEPEGEWEQRLRETVKLAARIKVITHVRAKLRQPRSGEVPLPPDRPRPRPAIPAVPPVHADGPSRFSLIAMGASTGGPAAVVQILRDIRPPIPLPILLVIHIGAPFGRAFADWLNDTLPMPVAEARDGEPLPLPGQARLVMAPPDRHLVIERGRLRLSSGPERHACRPSVDVLFESVAQEVGPSAIGCLLTGMGKDGAAGLHAMKRAGAATIVQDEATCVVFGMLREAIRLGAAGRILPLGEIGPAMLSLSRSTALFQEGR